MVFVTGDCHGEYNRFSIKNFPEQKDMTRDDIVIVCGDFGLWHPGKEEDYWFDWIESKPFTLVFVDGNHENFDRLYSDEFPIVDFHGGKAHRIRENLYHLMRGYVFDFDGKKFFAFGGASSHDNQDGILDRSEFESEEEFTKTVYLWRKIGRMFRVNHISWWKEELPTFEEMERGGDILDEHGNRVDYIITHCAPQDLVAAVFRLSESDRLTEFFKAVAETTAFDRWYFGHYHEDAALDYYGKYTVLYHYIERVV